MTTPQDRERAMDLYGQIVAQVGIGGSAVQVSLIADAFAAVREECAKIADDYSANEWARYKGRPPYKPDCVGRADDVVQGKSIAGEEIADLIRASSTPTAGGSSG